MTATLYSVYTLLHLQNRIWVTKLKKVGVIQRMLTSFKYLLRIYISRSAAFFCTSQFNLEASELKGPNVPLGNRLFNSIVRVDIF